MKRVWICAAVAVCLGAVTALGASQDGPQVVAEKFYQAYPTIASGVPDAKTLARLRPLLSASLAGLLKEADAAEIAYAKANKKEPVPPLVEGDLFSSLFEGADSAQVGLCQVSDQNVLCPTKLSHSEGGVGSPNVTSWSDTLILAAEPGGAWKVDDILFGGEWDFARKGTLKDSLREVVQEGREAVK